MSDNTKIEWADATVNAFNGCSVVSPGCTNCYAMRLAGTRMRNHPSREGLTRDSKAGPVWNGTVRRSETALLQPLRWRKARRIFWNAHGDTFHDAVPDEWIDQLLAVCALTPHHTHMILTKRPERMHAFFADAETRLAKRADHVRWINARGLTRRNRCTPEAATAPYPLPNVWLGVSAEDQSRAEDRIPYLLDTPAAVRFLSCEPLLGPIDLNDLRPAGGPLPGDPFPLTGRMIYASARGYEDSICASAGRTGRIDWVIVGGESGKGARPMEAEWARTLRDQCEEAGVAFHFKQWGHWLPTGQINGWGKPWNANRPLHAVKSLTGRSLDGRFHDDAPFSQQPE